MKIKKNNGFTLVELIIAISILSIVLSIGYGIINSSNKALKEQSEVFSGQMSINNVNKFLTKDLEQSKNLIGPLDESGTGLTELTESQLQQLVNNVSVTMGKKYKYTIVLNNNTHIDYEISVTKNPKNNKYEYDITKKESSVTIEIVSNQPLNIEGGEVQIPVKIKKNTSKYDIEIGYENRSKPNVYRFSVSSRYM